MIRVSARDIFGIINLYRDSLPRAETDSVVTCRNTSDTGDDYGQ